MVHPIRRSADAHAIARHGIDECRHLHNHSHLGTNEQARTCAHALVQGHAHPYTQSHAHTPPSPLAHPHMQPCAHAYAPICPLIQGTHKKFTSWFHVLDLIEATGHITPPKERPSEPCSVLTPPVSPRSSAQQVPETESESLTPRLMAMAAGVCCQMHVPNTCVRVSVWVS